MRLDESVESNQQAKVDTVVTLINIRFWLA